jgi:hypothetical protein
MFLLGRAGARHRSARFLFGTLLALVGLVGGIVGCFLVGAWCFTPHEVVYRNENILLFAPFALALTVMGLGAAWGRAGAIRKAFLLTAASLGLAALGCGLKMLPWSHQDNNGVILLMVPLWWGLTAGARALAGPSRAAGA